MIHDLRNILGPENGAAPAWKRQLRETQNEIQGLYRKYGGESPP